MIRTIPFLLAFASCLIAQSALACRLPNPDAVYHLFHEQVPTELPDGFIAIQVRFESENLSMTSLIEGEDAIILQNIRSEIPAARVRVVHSAEIVSTCYGPSGGKREGLIVGKPIGVVDNSLILRPVFAVHDGFIIGDKKVASTSELD